MFVGTTADSLSSPMNHKAVFAAIYLLIGVSFAGGFPVSARAGDIAVVVRPDTPADELSLREIRDLMLGERQFWKSSLRVTLLIRAPVSRERDVVLKVIYHMTEAQFRQFWISKVYRTETRTAPKIVYSSQMATALIAALPGSISFVDKDEVPKGLKVIRVDGKLPGQAGYPLR
jgi:ABC-type phosphate transport system substrate-binding protein